MRCADTIATEKLLRVGISWNPITAQSQPHTPKFVLVCADDENN